MHFDGTETAKQDGTHNAETKILTSFCSAVTCCGLIAPWLFQTARHLCAKVLLIKSIKISESIIFLLIDKCTYM